MSMWRLWQSMPRLKVRKGYGLQKQVTRLKSGPLRTLILEFLVSRKRWVRSGFSVATSLWKKKSEPERVADGFVTKITVGELDPDALFVPQNPILLRPTAISAACVVRYKLSSMWRWGYTSGQFASDALPA
jgi:hypothetical protein